MYLLYINSVLHRKHETDAYFIYANPSLHQCPEAGVIRTVETLSFNCVVTAFTQKHVGVRNDWHKQGSAQVGQIMQEAMKPLLSGNHKETRSHKMY